MSLFGLTRALFVVTTSMLLLFGCGPGYAVTETYPEQVELTLVGTLAGERTQEQECVWLIDRARTKFHLVLPGGWTVAYNPVRLIDPEGRTIAEDGDTLTAFGPTVIGETMCAAGPPFIVERIEKV